MIYGEEKESKSKKKPGISEFVGGKRTGDAVKSIEKFQRLQQKNINTRLCIEIYLNTNMLL